MATIAHLTDLHLRPPGVLTQGTVDADRFATAAIDALITRHPGVDAVVVTGDIADLGEPAAYDRAAMLLSRIGAPVFVMPGNHDKTARLRAACALMPGMAEPPVAPKLAHSHTVADITVVCLDTSVDDIDHMTHHGALGREQLDWLDATLAAAGPTLIAMHHPPFATGVGFMDAIGLEDREAFAAIVARHGNVQRIVCGHVHRTIAGTVGGTTAMVIPGTAHQVSLALTEEAPAGMVMEPPAIGLHTVTAAGAVSHVDYVPAFGSPRSFSGGAPADASAR